MAYTDILNQEPLYLQALRAARGVAPPPGQPELPEEEQSVLGSIGGTIADLGLGALNTVGTVLDTPASIGRGLLSGNFSRAFTGIFNPEDRVSGKELAGIEDNPDSWWDDIGGIGTEIVTDPLFWLTGATKAGKFLGGLGKAGAVERTAAGKLVKGATQAGMEATVRKAAAELGDKAVVEAARAYKPSYVAQALNKLGIGKYGDDLAEEVAKGLKAEPGMGGFVDEPARHALPGVSWFSDTTDPLLDRAAAKLTGKTPAEIAQSMDKLKERIRFGNWLPGKAAVAGAQAASTASEAAKNVVPVYGPARLNVLNQLANTFTDQAAVTRQMQDLDGHARWWVVQNPGKTTEDFFVENIEKIARGEFSNVSPEALFQTKGGFDPKRYPVDAAGRTPDQPGYVNPNRFYSQLTRVVEDKVNGPVGYDHLIATLKSNAVKNEEILDADLASLFADGKRHRPEEILAHYSKNVPQLDVEQLGRVQGAVGPDGYGIDSTKYHSYQVPDVPGKDPTSYKETLLRTPRPAGYEDAISTSDEAFNKYFDLDNELKLRLPSTWDEEAMLRGGYPDSPDIYPANALTKPDPWIAPHYTSASEYEDFLRHLKDVRKTKQKEADSLLKNDPTSFLGGHWTHEGYPNVLAHMRHDRVIDPVTGLKTRRIQEIQSDWMQQAREAGGGDPRAGFRTGEVLSGPVRNEIATQIEELESEYDVIRNALERQSEPDLLSLPDGHGPYDADDKAVIEALGGIPGAAGRLDEIERERLQLIERLGSGSNIPRGPMPNTWPRHMLRRAIDEAAVSGDDRIGIVRGRDIARAVGGPEKELGKYYDEILANEAKELTKAKAQNLLPYPGIETRANETGQMQVFDISKIKDKVLRDGQPLYKTGQDGVKLGATEFGPTGKATITAFEGADASTMFHEFGHLFRRTVAGADPGLIKRFESELGVVDGVWTREAEERFAEAYEAYRATGNAPTSTARSVFNAFTGFVKKLVGQAGAAPKGQPIHGLFEEMLGQRLPGAKAASNVLPGVAVATKAADLSDDGKQKLQQLLDATKAGQATPVEAADNLGNLPKARPAPLAPFTPKATPVAPEVPVVDPVVPVAAPPAPKNVLPGVKVAEDVAPVADDIPVVSNPSPYLLTQEEIGARINELGKREEELLMELGKGKTSPARAAAIEKELADMAPEMEVLSEEMARVRPPNPNANAANIQALTDELNAKGTTPARAAEITEAIAAAKANAIGKVDEIKPSVSATGPELAMDAAMPPAPPAKVGSLKARVKDVLSRQTELPGSTPSNPLGTATAKAADDIPPAAGAAVPPTGGASIPPPPKTPDPPPPGQLPTEMRDPLKDEGFNLIRRLASLFQRKSRGSARSYGQKLAHKADDGERAIAEKVRMVVDGHRVAIAKEVPQAVRQSEAYQHQIVDLIETGKMGDIISQYPSVIAFAQDAENLSKAAIAAQIRAGVPISELEDRAVKFMFRELNILPGSKLKKGLGAPKQVSATTRNIEGRDDMFRHMSTTWFNEFLSHDPRFATDDFAKGWQQWLDGEVAAGRRSAEDAATLYNKMAQSGEAAFRKASKDELLNGQKYQGYNAEDVARLTNELEVKQAKIKAMEGKQGHVGLTVTEQKQLDALRKDAFKTEAELKPHIEASSNADKLLDFMKDNIGDEYIKYAATNGGKKVGLFTADAIGGLEKYLTNAGRSQVVAQTLLEHISPFISTQKGPGTVPLGKALSEMTLGRNMQGTEEAYNRLRELLELPEDFDFSKATLPKSMVDEFTRTVKHTEGLPEASGLIRQYDRAMTLFKNYALLRPAFHVRNKISGTIQNLMFLSHSLDGERMARDIAAGKAIQGASNWPMFVGKGLDDAAATDEIRKMLHAYDVVPENAGLAGDVVSNWDAKNTQAIPGLDPQETRGPIQYVKDAWKSTKEAFASKEPFSSPNSPLNPLNVSNVRSKGDGTSKFWASVGHEKLGSAVEFQNRGIPFILGLQQGMDPATLAQKIRDAHVDYRNLSQFERETMRRIAPFYSYTRAMLPFTAKQLINNPGGVLAQTIRTANNIRGDEPVPDHLKDTLAIPLGKDENGTTSYLTGLGLMPEDSISILGAGLRTLGLRDNGGISQELSSMLNPVAKGFIEKATGRTLYQSGPGGGRELRDMDPVLGRIGANIFGGDPLNTGYLDTVVMNTIPSQVSAIKQATDPRKGIGSRLLTLITGQKIADVPVKTQEALIRQNVQEMMRDVGGRGYEKYYIPPDVYAKLTPDQQKRADALNNILKDLANRAKARGKQAKEQEASLSR